MNKLKVMVADSHEVFRLGITFILQRTEDMEVVAEAGLGSEVLQKAEACQPDVVVMDLVMDGSGIEVCRSLKEKHPGIKIVVMMSSTDEANIFNAITAGADGLLPKQIKSEELTGAVRMVKEGKVILDPAITSRVMNRVKNGFFDQERKEALLNPQERRILALIADGKTNKEIAQILMLSNNTIKNYVSGILSKLNFSNRAEAAAYAVRNNMGQYKVAN